MVNKADLPLAGRTADHLRAMLALRAEQRDVSVIETVATSGAGVEALAAAVDARAGRSATQKRASRLRRVRRLIAQTAGRQIRDRILTLDAPQSHALVQAALEGRCGCDGTVLAPDRWQQRAAGACRLSERSTSKISDPPVLKG